MAFIYDAINFSVLNQCTIFLGVCTNELPRGNNVLYSVWVSFAEIYNERVYDLFESVTRGKRRKEMKLLTDKEGRVYIKGIYF